MRRLVFTQWQQILQVEVMMICSPAENSNDSEGDAGEVQRAVKPSLAGIERDWELRKKRKTMGGKH